MSTFTPTEQTTIRTAAYGTVQLLSSARPGPISSTKQNVAGALTLNAVTGSVG